MLANAESPRPAAAVLCTADAQLADPVIGGRLRDISPRRPAAPPPDSRPYNISPLWCAMIGLYVAIE
ncbi:hypothetical protein E4U53_003002 [Claviceps sorghi]|nr:hypothetical protein E4U53_003002 [Claviceps sorghi]